MEDAVKTPENNELELSDEPRVPVHQRVYEQLRDAVLYGDLAPGQPVTIQGLVGRFDAGMTPVREAIRRLTSEGALEFRGNRRVLVPALTPKNIDELIFARQAIEPRLVLRATDRATGDDLSALRTIDDSLDQAIAQGDVAGYLRLNHRFHTTLYDLADAPILTSISDGLWLRFGPSLRVVCARMGAGNQPDRHKETLDAMRVGDGERAARAIREDVIQGMEQMRIALNDGDFAEGN